MVAGFEAIGCRGDAMVGLYVLVSRAAPDVYRGKMLTAPAESGLGGVVPASPAGGDSILQRPTTSRALQLLGTNSKSNTSPSHIFS